MLWENLLLYVPMSALLVIMPGPDFALVTRVALAQGRAAGTLAACGVALGIGLHTALAMLGISAAIAHFRLLFSLLEYGGGAFLCWMGFQSLRGASTAEQAVLRCGEASPVGAVTPSLRRSFAQGFLTNVLNPKAIVYFLTFLPQFMQPDAPLPRNSCCWAASSACSSCSGSSRWPTCCRRCALCSCVRACNSGSTAVPVCSSSASACDWRCPPCSSNHVFRLT